MKKICELQNCFWSIWRCSSNLEFSLPSSVRQSVSTFSPSQLSAFCENFNLHICRPPIRQSVSTFSPSSWLSHHLLKAVLSLVVENALFCSIGPRAELTLLDVDFIIRLSHLQIFQTTCKIASCILLFAISLLKAKNPNRTVKWATLNQSHHYPLLELELCERENTIRDGDSTALAAASTVYMYCLHCVHCLQYFHHQHYLHNLTLFIIFKLLKQ